MPTIVDAEGAAREISTAEYQRLMRGLEQGTTERVLEPTVPLDPALSQHHVRFWDCIDETWTLPLPKARMADYLSKRVVRCSCCTYTTNILHWGQDGSISTHTTNIRAQVKSHEQATLSAPVLTERGVGTELCSGCGFPFQVGKGLEHIVRIRGLGASHQSVEAILVNRFALTQSEPTIFDRKVMVGPDASQVEPDTSPRKSGRRRRRKRGS